MRLGLLLLLVGCSGATTTTADAGGGDADGQSPVCVLGESVACTGPGGCAGGQVCEGDRFGPCLCGPEDDAGSPRDAAVDAGSPDAGSSPDAAPADSGSPSCGDCDDANPCTRDECVAGRCEHSIHPDETPCNGRYGQCWSGACCEGCWDGSSCQAGTAVESCGGRGGRCASCVDTNPCTDDRCGGLVGCTTTFETTGTPCPGGECRASVCTPCGFPGTDCCDGDARPTEPGVQACVAWAECLDVPGPDSCTACGRSGQPCCGGFRCEVGFCDFGTVRCP